jgi:hypothetical protein
MPAAVFRTDTIYIQKSALIEPLGCRKPSQAVQFTVRMGT